MSAPTDQPYLRHFVSIPHFCNLQLQLQLQVLTSEIRLDLVPVWPSRMHLHPQLLVLDQLWRPHQVLSSHTKHIKLPMEVQVTRT